jgi:hypothetical protein
MPIKTKLSEEDLDRALGTLMIRQEEEGYSINIPLMGIRKVKDFETMVNFLKGYYSGFKPRKKL